MVKVAMELLEHLLKLVVVVVQEAVMAKHLVVLLVVLVVIMAVEAVVVASVIQVQKVLVEQSASYGLDQLVHSHQLVLVILNFWSYE